MDPSLYIPNVHSVTKELRTKAALAGRKGLFPQGMKGPQLRQNKSGNSRIAGLKMLSTRGINEGPGS